MNSGPDDERIIVHCHAGGRAGRLLDALSKATGATRVLTAQSLLQTLAAGARLLILDGPSWDALESSVRPMTRGLERFRVLVVSEDERPRAGVESLSARSALEEAMQAVQGLLTEGPAAPPGDGELVMAAEPTAILVVDDSELLNRITTAILTRAGYAVRCLTNPFELSVAMKEHRPAMILVDYNIPVLTGDKVVEFARRTGVRVPMVMYSNVPEEMLREVARRCGAAGYIRKGTSPRALTQRLRDLLRET